ncbi:AAA family ATPase [Schleiferia thermophila]|jgi:MoxR-like ATPase|uniref:MoxR-like ATPase n=1 Tax=Schleiferia thermophila TaxID=884107 RepID=A0A369A6R5_9FLAO|nr:MoxR family ATPase [Schleiferia thermophila]KFD38282.1 ATPase AAA [Schleiferia thermophila str. Yellowstone]RCX04855.1 MoxR-like ATPase [Schleiferia thermophila]GCD79619.1 ATPase AAA [Schleiferia thermophila]
MNEPKEITEAKAIIQKFQELRSEISKVIIGQDEVVEQLLISILCQGHSLLVGVPGLAKTLLINTLSKCLGLQFNRIQFTPDLMPSDIIGAEILDENRKFKFIPGPVFANIVLADEINRTPPKTQSALLEAMQEKAVTAAGHRYKLPLPFFVLATQNPIEQEGTYPLPEAQLDRFMFNIVLDYPSRKEEIEIVKRTTADILPTPETILTSEHIDKASQIIRQLPVTDVIYEYCIDLVRKTRPTESKAPEITKKFLNWGAGPRASQYLVMAAKAYGFLHGKFTPDFEDVRKMALPVLRHRIVRNYQAEAEGLTTDDLVRKLF